MPVASSVIVTLAEATTPPCESVTVPRMVPRSRCAKAAQQKTTNRTTVLSMATWRIDTPSCVVRCENLYTLVLDDNNIGLRTMQYESCKKFLTSSCKSVRVPRRVLLLTVTGLLLGATVGNSPFLFRDKGDSAGLSVPNTYGGKARKDYILETTGNGAAIFDYDGDGRKDILITNGTRFDAKADAPPATLQLYHNEGNGHFREVSEKAGFHEEGWAQGVCVGDYDNDGHLDVAVTYYGHNRLYRNRGDGTFEDVTQKAGLPTTGTRYGSGCTFLDYDRNGKLDLFISNYVDLDLSKTPKPGSGSYCEWKGIPVMCG